MLTICAVAGSTPCPKAAETCPPKKQKRKKKKKKEEVEVEVEVEVEGNEEEGAEEKKRKKDAKENNIVKMNAMTTTRFIHKCLGHVVVKSEHGAVVDRDVGTALPENVNSCGARSANRRNHRSQQKSDRHLPFSHRFCEEGSGRTWLFFFFFFTVVLIEEGSESRKFLGLILKE